MIRSATTLPSTPAPRSGPTHPAWCRFGLLARSLAGLPLAGIALAGACKDSTSPGTNADHAYVRVVGSAFQATDDPTDDNPAGCPCTPLSIDVLFDSATAAPSVVGMAGDTLAPGSAGAAPSHLNAFYTPITAGLHSFIARATGPTHPTFFTNDAGTTYLPRQYLTHSTYYTFLIAGVNPAQPDSGPPVLAPVGNFASTGANAFPLFVDDPFTPPSTQASGQRVLQSRFRLINAAPFALTGAPPTSLFAGTVVVYLTPSGVVPTPDVLATLVPAAQVDQHAGNAASLYVNATAGTYELTVSVIFGPIVYQAPITLGAGEVRTLVLQNTLPAGVDAIPAGGVPPESATEYFKLTNILDNQFK